VPVWQTRTRQTAEHGGLKNAPPLGAYKTPKIDCESINTRASHSMPELGRNPLFLRYFEWAGDVPIPSNLRLAQARDWGTWRYIKARIRAAAVVKWRRIGAKEIRRGGASTRLSEFRRLRHPAVSAQVREDNLKKLLFGLLFCAGTYGNGEIVHDFTLNSIDGQAHAAGLFTRQGGAAGQRGEPLW